MKRTDPELIGDIIQNVFRSAGLEKDEARQRAMTYWIDIVGPGVNRLTTRRYVDSQGALHVFIASSSVKSDLGFSRSQILKALNECVGSDALTDLIIH